MTIMNPEGTLENKLEKLFVAYGGVGVKTEDYLRFLLMIAKEIEEPEARLAKYEEIADLWLSEPEKWNWKGDLLNSIIEQAKKEKRDLRCGGGFVQYSAEEPEERDHIIVGVELYNSAYDMFDDDNNEGENDPE